MKYFSLSLSRRPLWRERAAAYKLRRTRSSTRRGILGPECRRSEAFGAFYRAPGRFNKSGERFMECDDEPRSPSVIGPRPGRVTFAPGESFTRALCKWQSGLLSRYYIYFQSFSVRAVARKFKMITHAPHFLGVTRVTPLEGRWKTRSFPTPRPIIGRQFVPSAC